MGGASLARTAGAPQGWGAGYPLGGGAHILVLASEVVPLPGLPTNGGGLRGWTLARGLESAGFRVTLLFPAETLDAVGPGIDPGAISAARPHTFRWDEALAAVDRIRPDVVVSSSWLLAAQLAAAGGCPTPLAVDVAGPVLLEFLYQDHAKALDLAPRKPRGLAAADFVTCAGERQRAYFYPWLLLAGFDEVDLAARVATVPISAAPVGQEAAPAPLSEREAEPTILFAGLALPWQDPTVPLAALIEGLERRGRGRLEVRVGEHPVHSRGVRWLDWLRERARESGRVVVHETVPRPYADTLALYRRADLAFDLFARGPEREIAVATRTVDYLAAGLPPLHGDYDELAGPIAAYGAGLVVDPADPAAVSAAVGALLDDPARLRAMRDGARRLVAERLAWDRTIAPLATWCANPTRRPRAGPLSPTALVPELARALADTEAERDRFRAAAAEREAYARHLEAAWAEGGARLAAADTALGEWRRAPWRSAARQGLAALRARLRRAAGGSADDQLRR